MNEYVVEYIYGSQTVVSGKNILEAISKCNDVNNIISVKKK